MRAFSKTLLVLLLAAVVAAPLAALEFLRDVALHERLAGCHSSSDHSSSDHDRGGTVPAPRPASHSCCQDAHHPAILLQNSSSRPSLEASAQIESFQDATAVTVF